MTKGERIHALRTARGMTLEELGKRIHVGKGTVKKYETGMIDNIPSDKIEALADALETTPAYIMGWSDTQDAEPPDAPQTDEARILSVGVDKMPPDDRKRALEVMRLMFTQYADYFEKTDK